MREVPVAAAPLDQLAALLPDERAVQLAVAAERARAVFGDRVVWHVNATSSGGGVAEMLQALLAYGNGAGIENRWLVLDGDPEFFDLTKRLHNLLHGHEGDGGPLGEPQRRHWAEVSNRNAADLLTRISPGDIVVLHDPQTAGLAHAARRRGASVVWRCHVGRDRPNDCTDRAWEFLRPHLADAHMLVFSRLAYAPPWIDDDQLAVIPPSIDPFSSKNRRLGKDEVRAVLARVGLVADGVPERTVLVRRRTGVVGHVRPHGESGGLVLDGVPPAVETPLVVQVSRWDRLKDMGGVMAGFALLMQSQPGTRAHLMLLGPETEGVTDDPEGAAVLDECRAQWRSLPDDVRDRIHLAAVPMDDPDENALIVNAAQRHARVVVQKSLVEGFGLTVTEAMWKSRPVVASRVGGIQDQIKHGRDGLLLDDPTDLAAFAAILRQALLDEPLARRLGRAAHRRVLDQYVGDRHLEQYAELFSRLVSRDA
jgi:trehalose synthase